MKDNIKRGDIWFVDFGMSSGRIQGSKRPCVVVSNDICNTMSPVITVVALTSNVEKATRKNLPTHVLISKGNGVEVDSIALCEQPRSIDKSQLNFKVGEVDTDTMILIEKALMLQCGIDNSNTKVNFNYEYAKDLLVSISQLDKLSKQMNINFSAKKIMMEQFINYCKSFEMDYKIVTQQIKNNIKNNNTVISKVTRKEIERLVC